MLRDKEQCVRLPKDAVEEPLVQNEVAEVNSPITTRLTTSNGPTSVLHGLDYASDTKNVGVRFGGGFGKFFSH